MGHAPDTRATKHVSCHLEFLDPDDIVESEGVSRSDTCSEDSKKTGRVSDKVTIRSADISFHAIFKLFAVEIKDETVNFYGFVMSLIMDQA